MELTDYDIFVIEGLDGSGKSSLIKQLSKLTGYNIHHFDKPKGNNNFDKYYYQQGQFEMMFDLLNKVKDPSIILDRSHIGEYIYGPEFRDLYPDYLSDLEKRNKHLNICVIYLQCEYEDAVKRLNKRENDKLDYDEIEYCLKQEKFGRFCYYSQWPCIMVNTSEIKENEMINYIKGKINE